MDNTGFVKLPRSLLNEDWAKNPATLTVFIRLLSKANYEAREWQGYTIPRGAAVVTHRSLANECGISPRAVRTALQKLCAQNIAKLIAHPSKGPSAQRSAHPCTIVSICNYDNYSNSGKAQRAPKRAPNTPESAQQSAQNGALPKEIDIKIEIYKEVFGEDIRLLPILEDWISYKKEMGQAYKGRKGITQFCNLLKEYSSGDPEKGRRIVTKAMAYNWGSIYPEKDSTPPRAANHGNPRIIINAQEEGISTI